VKGKASNSPKQNDELEVAKDEKQVA
jgi:hypothetical protein